ncbi:hypothetical protein [Corynebacterium sp.]|uniref:hypothetical protein n=1 Tax=Corynebacterium sp. TaxID=1720 RepID=UPI0026DA83E7|nr:hypothetical protein [Corynebacterium sp.]MDO4915417.1 hypothetical protein [Corynebacterium sp.]
MPTVDYNSLRGVDAYKAAFPNALQGLDAEHLHAVVEAVHSGVLEGWKPTEDSVAAIAQSPIHEQMTSERAQAIYERVRSRYLEK